MSLKFWYSHEGVLRMFASFFKCVAAEKRSRIAGLDTSYLADKHMLQKKLATRALNSAQNEHLELQVFLCQNRLHSQLSYYAKYLWGT
jgi:hypothetical protein